MCPVDVVVEDFNGDLFTVVRVRVACLFRFWPFFSSVLPDRLVLPGFFGKQWVSVLVILDAWDLRIQIRLAQAREII